MIYLDQAATSLQRPDCVAKAVFDAINHAGNAARSTAEPSLFASNIIYEARRHTAQLFNAKPENVAFTSGITESLNLVIESFLHKGHVITTANDHNSVLRPLYARAGNLDVTVLPVDAEGKLDYALLERAFRPDTLAVVTTAASNVTGNMIDISAVGTMAREHDALFILDSAQAAGIVPLDIEKFGVDILCFTGHKDLLGPQGTGGIVLRDGLHPVPVKVGGSGFYSFSKTHPEMMPYVFEAGTANSHGLAGFNAAVKWLLQNKLNEKAICLANHFCDGLRSIPNVKIYGSFDGNRVPVVSCNIGSIDSGLVADRLWHDYAIAVRSGIHCAPLLHQALGTARQGTVRFSFSRFNTLAETDAAIQAMKEIQSSLC